MILVLMLQQNLELVKKKLQFNLRVLMLRLDLTTRRKILVLSSNFQLLKAMILSKPNNLVGGIKKVLILSRLIQDGMMVMKMAHGVSLAQNFMDKQV